MDPITAPCGNRAFFDYESGFSYRCEACMAVIGSIGMPRECRAIMEMDRAVEKLSGNVKRINGFKSPF
jgi:hypothetical protein